MGRSWPVPSPPGAAGAGGRRRVAPGGLLDAAAGASRTGGSVVFQTWISYQNPKFISVDKQANNDVMHFVEFGETNRLSD